MVVCSHYDLSTSSYLWEGVSPGVTAKTNTMHHDRTDRRVHTDQNRRIAAACVVIISHPNSFEVGRYNIWTEPSWKGNPKLSNHRHTSQRSAVRENILHRAIHLLRDCCCIYSRFAKRVSLKQESAEGHVILQWNYSVLSRELHPIPFTGDIIQPY